MFKTIISKFIVGGVLSTMAVFGSVAVYNYTTDLGAGVAQAVETGDVSGLNTTPELDFTIGGSSNSGSDYEARDLASETSKRFN